LVRYQTFRQENRREKLRKIEALFAGAGTAGLERVRARLAELGRRDLLPRIRRHCQRGEPSRTALHPD
jgi:hypothetical protein